ncbi:MAG TPA: hypothetical protein VMU59_14120 [Caulobacteraceae bacterium]|nr:hypothetical protein [Caulobacteraceae bacterium]
MAFATIAPPAGVFRNGTTYQSKGRWCDAHLVRFQQDQIKPVGGWQVRSGAAAFAGAARALLTWRDNSNSRWIAVGTHAKLYVQAEDGDNADITPTGYTVGRADAAQNLGYGGGAYGADVFGEPRPNTTAYLPATTWSLDGWGEDLVACADTDGKIYLWALDPAAAAAAVSGAPTGCQGLVVSEERFLFALGAGGDRRKVAWCDQQNISLWTADATNQAGDYDLATLGTLQCGKAVAGGALLFTDVDVWRAGYIGTPLVFGFQRVGSGCGVISKGAVAARDSIAAWMGRGGFWLFDGQSVQPLDCDVQDHVFGDLNLDQSSKVSAVHLADHGEVWWFYPSAASTECDRYVAWAYRESSRQSRNVWTIGALARLAGSGRGVYPTPLMVDAEGLLYEHETGVSYVGAAAPYLESGPIELGQGDTQVEVQRLIPDASADGDVTATFYGRPWPDGPETAYGPFALTSPTDVLFQARQIRVRFTGAASDDWRIGAIRLDLIPGDPQ